jgi:hypothetical protein
VSLFLGLIVVLKSRDVYWKIIFGI